MDFDDLIAPSGETFKYKTELNVGDTFQGILLAKPEVKPDTDYVTKEQKKSSKGNPLWQLKLQVQVGDDAKTLYLSGGAYYEALNAFREVGSKEFRGMVFGMKRLPDTPSKTAGFTARKEFAVKVALPKGE